MDEEIRFHIEMETEKNIAAGLSRSEARRRAVAAFGGVERHREGLREGRRVPVVEAIWQDVSLGARFLTRDPWLAFVAVVTIALGVGAATTVFSAVNAMLLRPLPIAGAERLATIQESRTGAVSNGLEGMLIPYERYVAYRDAATDVFESLAAHRLEESISLRLRDATVAVNGALTSGNYFGTLGVRPTLGRAYASDDAAEIVISHELWTTRFNSDPASVGRTVGIDGRTVEVVGVAPAGFGGATAVANQIWVPVGVRGADRKSWDVRMVPLGRLRQGLSVERAAEVVDGLSRRIPPNEEATIRSARLEPVSAVPSDARGPVTGFLGMLLGLALLVLLIAAANIAAVMLARGFARRRELAVRVTMGATRGRIVRHLLAESLVVFALGGLAGVGLAYLGSAWLTRIQLPPQMPPLLLHLAPDRRVLAFAVSLTALTGVLFGIVPALQASRPELLTALKAGTAGSVGGESRARSFFVGAQVALAVTLLLAATLFARSLQRGLRTDIGFDPDGVVVATIDLGSPLDYDRERGRAFQRSLLQRIRALPRVERAGLSQYVLLSGSRSGGGVRRADARDAPIIHASYSSVSADYFETMRIDVVAGRGFTEADDEAAPPVVVINRTLADRLWPGQNPIGQLMQGVTGQQPAEVVGMTDVGRYTFLTEEPTAFVFLPYSQVYRASMALHVRAPGAEAATLRSIAEEVRMLDPNVALGMAGPARELVGIALFPQRFAAQLVGAFGGVGLILAALGIYGVLAYQVTRRTREFGVRRALGATSLRLVTSVVRLGAVLAAAGCAAGTIAGAGFGLAARSLLFGIRPLDPVTFVAVPALLFAVALLASWLPAVRASGVQPSEALRSE